MSSDAPSTSADIQTLSAITANPIPWRFLAIQKMHGRRGKLIGRKIYLAKIGCPLRQSHWLKRFFLTRRDAEAYARRACIRLNRIQFPESLGRGGWHL